MKISSITDVITNSSTEVFVLMTNKSLDEVSKILSEITKGYDEPEIMEKGSGVLSELIDWEYLVDPDDPESMDRYLLKAITTTTYYDDEYKKCKIENSEEILKAFINYIWDNRKELGKFLHEKFDNTEFRWKSEDGTIWEKIDSIGYDTFFKRIQNDIKYEITEPENYPPGFVRFFLDSWTNPKPETIELPVWRNANTYVGKIGFFSSDDNSIPYEDFEKIDEILNGQHWHLG